MFMKMDEPETISLNPSLPSGISDTEVIIIGSGAIGGGGNINIGSSTQLNCEMTNINGSGGVSTITTTVLKNKISAPGQTCRMLKKSAKCRRVPLTMVQVLLFGLILLFLILFCIICETWWSSAQNSEDPSSFWTGKSGAQPGSITQNSIHRLLFEPHSPDDHAYHKKLVEEVNSNPNAKWKAVYNKFASRAKDPQMADKDALRHAITKNMDANEWSTPQMFADTESQIHWLSQMRNFSLPKRFDSREKWSECASVHRVVNQGGCGSCWAMSSTSVMSDRICVHSNGSKQPQISAQDLIECCPHCGGCRGTVWALFSFVYWKEKGLVTGGDYGSYEGCKPYEKSASCGSPCSIEIYNSKQGNQDVCWSICQQLYEKQYQDDLHRAEKVYWVRPNSLNQVINTEPMNRVEDLLKRHRVDYETLIKRELLLNGPMIGCFVVYDEFQHYRSGIYESMTSNTSKELYGHCAKLIGWGEEKGQAYWIYMNTWGRSWGENGFFRVAIKEVPEEAAAGIPLL